MFTFGHDSRTTILALSWRDIRSPKFGGAETHTHEMLRRLNPKRFRIFHLAPCYEGLKEKEVIDGVTYLRKGGVLSVILYAMRLYHKNRKDIDIVIDQCNTHRFFTRFWVEKEKRIFYIHQLTREIWDTSSHFPLSFIGKRLENLFLRLQKNDYTVTVSESTKNDLVALGFHEHKICIVPPGVIGRSALPYEKLTTKKNEANFIYVGRYAKYKGIDDSIEALGLLKRDFSNAKLWLLGKPDMQYTEKCLSKICDKYSLSYGSKQEDDVVIKGFVSDEEKFKLQEQAKALLFPSIREGWGIIVTEAAICGTPSIVYNSPGCRDAVNFGKAGFLCSENTPKNLYECMKLCLTDEQKYQEVRRAAYDFSIRYNWSTAEDVFGTFLENLISKTSKLKD